MAPGGHLGGFLEDVREGLAIHDRSRNIGPNEAARLLQVSPSTMQRWIDAGFLAAHRTAGGHRRMVLAELVRFARERGLPLSGDLENSAPLVLLVDDDPDVLAAFSARIAALRGDLRVLTADSGFVAGFLVSRSQPQLVLLDIRMPGIDGIEVCRIIKGDPSTAGIRVVGVTASRDRREVEALLAAGAAEVRRKPLAESDFRSILEDAFPTARQRRAGSSR